jgi:hypothetical protein
LTLQDGINEQWEKFWALLMETWQQNTIKSFIPIPKTLPYMAAGIRQQRNLKKHHWRKKDKPGHY